MIDELIQRLKLSHQPVGIWFENEMPSQVDIEPSEVPRCVVASILMASKGKVVCFDELHSKCPGGAVGLGFGDAFAKRNASTPFLLSHGAESPGFTSEDHLPPLMIKGERFFDSPETVERWKEALHLTEADYSYVVFAPMIMPDGHLSSEAIGRHPDLVFALANPDQLSALVIMAGYRNGRPLNVVAPFCAGCQSIVLAKQQLSSDQPMAIMGMFDIAQRSQIEKDLLSLTMPYNMFEEIARYCGEGCLISHSWEVLEKRL